jgi:hypothetical protein
MTRPSSTTPNQTAVKTQLLQVIKSIEERKMMLAVRRPRRGGVYGLIATIAGITTMKKKMKEGSNKSNLLAVRHPNAVPNHPSKKEMSCQIVTRLHLLLLPLLR